MFHKNLRYYRTQAGLTAKSLADRLGISDRTYRNYENTSREPDYATLCRLADALQVTLDQLLREDPQGEEGDLFRQPAKRFSTEELLLVYLYNHAAENVRHLMWTLLDDINPQQAIREYNLAYAEKERLLGKEEIGREDFSAWVREAQHKKDQVLSGSMDLSEYKGWLER